MAHVRYWCASCEAVVTVPVHDACVAVGHITKPIGQEVSVQVVVTDRRLDLDVNQHGYWNMVGHSEGRESLSHEAHTRARIEEMRRIDQAAKRERRINPKMRDNPKRAGAIPSALLFALKKQYGQDYLKEAEKLMRSQGCWWGD